MNADFHVFGALSGVFGGGTAFYMALYAYISDVSSGKSNFQANTLHDFFMSCEFSKTQVHSDCYC